MADAWNRATGEIKDAVETAEELGQKAAARLEDERVQAVIAMETAVYRLEEKASEARGGLAAMVRRTSRYLRNNDAGAMMKDAEGLLRRYPTQFLAAGIVLGFVLAKGLTRSEN